MAKRDLDAPVAAGERLLADWGISDTASPDALSAVVGRATVADLAIARRLAARTDDAGVPALQRLADSGADKSVRRAAKGALYRLQQRGIQVPETTPVPAPMLLAPAGEGHVSAVDGRGDQLIWLLKPRPDGLAHLFAVTNDPEGLREVELNLITRKALKQAREELAAKHAIRMVPTEWRYCDFLIHRALAWARARHGHIHGDYPGLRTQFFKAPPAVDLAPLIVRAVDAEAVRADATLLARSPELLEEPEFRTWFLSPEQLQPYLDEIEHANESPLVLNAGQQSERASAVVERAVREQFQGERQASYVRRLYEIAYYLNATGRSERARQALAAALALADSTQGGRDVPFCEQLVRTSLAAWLQVAAEREAERTKSSLIVTPQQFAAERQRR